MSDPIYSITDEQLAKATELFQEALYDSTLAKQEYDAKAQRLQMLTAQLEKINFAYHIERDQEHQAQHAHPSSPHDNVITLERKDILEKLEKEKGGDHDGYL